MSSKSESLPAPIKSLFPLVKIRLISHLKYHLVKERIRQDTDKLNRSNSLITRKPKLAALKPVAEVPKRIERMHTIKGLARGNKSSMSMSFCEGLYWPKKLKEVRRGLRAVDTVQNRRMFATMHLSFPAA